MKKYQIYYVVFSLILFGALCYVSSNNSNIELSYDDIPEIIQKGDQKQEKPLIKEINEKNAKVQSIAYDNVDMILRKDIAVRLTGKIYYEKPKNSRLIVESRLGKETDAGSNSESFWFWSHRLDDCLYFAKYENLYDTPLKTPFNPGWIVETLGISNLNEEAEYVEYEDKVVLKEHTKSIENKPVIKLTLLDKQNKRILGHYILNLENKVIVSSEIKEFYEIDGYSFPKKMKTVWFEENVSIEWNFNPPKVNSNLPKSLWMMPKSRNKKELRDFSEVLSKDLRSPLLFKRSPFAR